MKVDIKQQGRIFHLTWDDAVEMRVSRIREQSNGDYRGLLMVSQNGRCLINSMMNLSVSSARASLSKSLNIQDNKHKWPVMLEEMCYHVTTRLATGESVQRISSEADIEPQEYTLYPLLPKGEATIVYGLGGTKKSYLALLACIAVQLPWNDNPLGWVVNESPGHCLYLDWETNQNTLNRRLKWIVRGMGLPMLELDYRRCSRTLVDDIEPIQQQVFDSKPQLLVIDSAGYACGVGDIKEQMITTNFFGAIRELDTTTLIITHTSKEGAGPYGSVYWTNSARSVWETQGSQVAGEKVSELAMFHRKSNDSGLFEPLGYEVAFDNMMQSTIFSLQDVKTMAGITEGLSLRERIFEALKSGKMTSKELASEVNSSKASVETTLYRNSNTFVKMDNYWGIKSHVSDSNS